jgi:hypothetical protein
MNVLRRLLAGLVFLLAAAVLLAGLAAGVGVWVVKGPAAAKAGHAFARAEAALDLADQAVGQAKASLDRAAERLDGVRAEQRRLALEPQRGNALGRMLGRTVQRQIAPELGNAHEKLHTVAEAALVVNTVLEDVGGLPFLSAAGLDTDRLADLNGRLAAVSPAAWELSRRLGEPDPDPDGDAGAQLSATEAAVRAARGLLAEYEPRLREVRERAAAVKARAFAWLTPAAVLISALGFWVALSQVAVMAWAVSLWRRGRVRDA